jgi:hypothetical protein
MQRMRQIGQEQMEKMRQSIRLEHLAAVSVSTEPLDTAISGHTHSEDQTVVHVTHHFFKGHEIAVTERIRFTEDGTAIVYVHEVKGPKGDPVVNEVKLDV